MLFCASLKPLYVMTFGVIPSQLLIKKLLTSTLFLWLFWRGGALPNITIFMSSFKHLYVVDAIPKNISFLCQCLKPPYVMTFDVIPIFFLHFRMVQRITSTSGRAQKKKLEQRRQTFSMLIFLGVEKVVDVNHLRPSMLIFSMLIPHPDAMTSLHRVCLKAFHFFNQVLFKRVILI